jgi:hypothetical protein
MIRIDAELEDIPLTDSHVLDQTPRGVGDIGRLRSPQRGRQPGDRLIEVQVGAATIEQIQHVFS